MKDITGQKFGRWTAIRPTGTHRGAVIWLVRCDCGTEKEVLGINLRYGGSKSCGCLKRELAQRRGEECHNWKGGRKLTKGGYVEILIDGKYVPEHRFVMEQHLGRPLFPDETVHHKNGFRNQNNIDNLELKASSHGKGQTLPDLIGWAKEILQRYEPQALN